MTHLTFPALRTVTDAPTPRDRIAYRPCPAQGWPPDLQALWQAAQGLAAAASALEAAAIRTQYQSPVLADLALLVWQSWLVLEAEAAPLLAAADSGTIASAQDRAPDPLLTP